MTDESYMQRCLDLASHARCHAAPNPMVGAVVVWNGQIIGEGFHSCAGKPHAEVEAVNAVKNKELLKESTLYVSLEPCCHYGKTPPCTELILQHHIPKIVVGCTDPNPQVGGKGIARLLSAGCEVKVGVLEAQCRELNRRFFTYQSLKRPYVLLKWAQTADGFMDVERDDNSNNEGFGMSQASVDASASQSDAQGCPQMRNNWITNEALLLKVHQWRAEECAIWVGANTLLHDNPQLNVRYCAGRQPLRLMHCSRLPENYSQYHFFDHSQPSWVFNAERQGEEPNLRFVRIEGLETVRGIIPPETLQQMLHSLFERQITSVMVEGGRRTLQSFIQSGLWDEVRVLVGSQKWKKGLEAPSLASLQPVCVETMGDNQVSYYRNVTV
ncbi:MAG: bifunctional diaminohydroxyphosphoribosylaminopyrimidine deaminase/5-amino-6-(5-phosphoribosylamino)uracil reductase RibD [Bacteroidales bacterium]|nr:bifunctional diaminohydroxyphosphoribosylaminopyrimidine deaminase/5-amino-6-(5-phosphoribosylamino)uracil reductase RibD [Bacteroidales bacterium]